MENEEAFDLAVADLYRASSGELPWTAALTRMSDLLRAFGAYLHGVNLSDGTLAFGYDVGGFHPSAALDYIRRYHDIDPRVPLVVPLEIGEWVSCHDHFDDKHVARDPFYQDFLIPYGGRYVSGAKIYQDGEIVAILGIHRGVGMRPLNSEELSLARRFGLHVGQALGLWRRQRQLVRDMLMGNAVLQRMTQPMLLLDEQMQLHYCNDSAKAILDADPRLSKSDGRLMFASRDDRAELAVALRTLLPSQPARRSQGAKPEKVVIRLESREELGLLLLVVIPLHPRETMGAFGTVSLALVLIHDAAARLALDPIVIGAAFDLTPAEARVAVQICAGAGVKAVASSLGVAASTVKSQLQQVFEKVGVSRQGELAAALAGLSVVIR